MKIFSFLFFVLFLASPHITKSQEKESFKTEYGRIVALAKKWELVPDSIIEMSTRNRFWGRRITVYTKFSLVEMRTIRRPVTYESIRKIKYTRAGIKFERTKVWKAANGFEVIVKRMNDHYLLIDVKDNFSEDRMVEERYITVKKSDGLKGTQKYYVNN